jgi:hypothetical protein
VFSSRRSAPSTRAPSTRSACFSAASLRSSLRQSRSSRCCAARTRPNTSPKASATAKSTTPTSTTTTRGHDEVGDAGDPNPNPRWLMPRHCPGGSSSVRVDLRQPFGDRQPMRASGRSCDDDSDASTYSIAGPEVRDETAGRPIEPSASAGAQATRVDARGRHAAATTSSRATTSSSGAGRHSSCSATNAGSPGTNRRGEQLTQATRARTADPAAITHTNTSAVNESQPFADLDCLPRHPYLSPAAPSRSRPRLTVEEKP